MNFIDRDNLPVEIKNNELPKDENKKYQMCFANNPYNSHKKHDYKYIPDTVAQHMEDRTQFRHWYSRGFAVGAKPLFLLRLRKKRKYGRID